MIRPKPVLHHFETEQWIPVAIEEVFRFFANPENLPRIMPPSSGTRLVRLNIVPPSNAPLNSRLTPPVAGIGSEIITSFLVIPYLPFRKRWIARITEFEWDHCFADVQQEGPFKSFHHWHVLTSEERGGKAGTTIRDMIDYEIGFGPLDPIVNWFVSRQLNMTFQYRQAALEKILVQS